MIILFLNNKIKNCTIYQYGIRTYNILIKNQINNYIYKEIESFDEYIEIINSINPNLIIYNYHCSTMSWLNNDTIQKIVKNIAISQESNYNIFDTIISFDYNKNEFIVLDKLLDFDKIYTDLKINEELYNKKEKIYIEVSFGEIVDKYSILELKKKYIKDTNKISEIQKEIDYLEKYIENIKTSEFYKQLLYINEQIWIDTDKIKQIDYNSINYLIPYTFELYIYLSNKIFENNQKRFRLKNYFNILTNSNIKEYKSYSENNCFIQINDEKEIYQKIPEINYLCISYDFIYFNNNYKHIIHRLFKNPNIKFLSNNDDNINIPSYNLLTYNIDETIRNIFEFNTIKYKSGGKLGDFLNQLSVISEKFYETGRKGELYICENLEHDGKFDFGLEHTYNDTYLIICSQVYIKEYKIYDNQQFDIDLSIWRKQICYFIGQMNYNWHNIFKDVYGINWGHHKWLISNNINQEWNDKIIINVTPYRFFSEFAKDVLIYMTKHELNNCIFISNEKEHYDFFCEKTGLIIKYYKPLNFEETVIIINSCKYGFFGFSSCAVIANALHKKCFYLGKPDNDYVLNCLKDGFPHIIDIIV